MNKSRHDRLLDYIATTPNNWILRRALIDVLDMLGEERYVYTSMADDVESVIDNALSYAKPEIQLDL